jgi:hypothetical protein
MIGRQLTGEKPMNRLPVVIAIAGGTIASMYAPAARSATLHVSAKRLTMIQVNDCMTKRMYADRQISYNDAARVCKQWVYQQMGISASGPLVAADTSGKR